MVFSVAFLVSYLSQCMTLYPGDVISTGTPGGIGPMKVGDIVEVKIDGHRLPAESHPGRVRKKAVSLQRQMVFLFPLPADGLLYFLPIDRFFHPHDIPQPPDSFDFALHHISGLQILFGTEGCPDGGPGGDDVSRFQGHELGDAREDLRDFEDHLFALAVLAQLPVHPQTQAELVRIGNFVFQDQTGPQRRKGILPLHEEPVDQPVVVLMSGIIPVGYVV